MVTDLAMPGIDGLELCRRLRSSSAALPIIFVTSREDEFDRVLGLEIGADDYLCKPFSMRELMERIKVLLRRAALSATAEPDTPANTMDEVTVTAPRLPGRKRRQFEAKSIIRAETPPRPINSPATMNMGTARR